MNNKLIILLTGLQAIIQASSPCLAGSAESQQQIATTAIPAQIKAPGGYTPALITHAIGDQIYQCTLNKEKYTWVLQAPDARLLDDKGQIVGNHYSGPIWEYKEGSRIVGQVINKLDVNPDSSISWLLVKVIAHKGKGLFSDINYINRINTIGGLPPSTGCNENHLGSEKRVSYSADYVFYK
jgi:hypothetical protein